MDSWKIFDQIYERYDVINRILSLGQDIRWRKITSSHLPSSCTSLLDLASGTGDQLISSMESNPSIQNGVGIDLSEKMLEIAKQKVEQKSYRDKVVFQKKDAANLGFSDDSFDAITFSFGIRNLPNPSLGIKEMHRVLKPGGKALILEFSLPSFPIKPFYLFYLRHILPHLGGLLSKNREAYRYLNETIEAFPYGKAFCSLMEKEGFCRVKAYPMNLGTVTLYTGEKDESLLV